MKRVFVCSPFRAENSLDRHHNVMLAEQACWMVLKGGGAPFAPHLLYTRFINERDEKQRATGIAAGKAFLASCDWMLVVGSKDRRVVTEGMHEEILEAVRLGIEIQSATVYDGIMEFDWPNWDELLAKLIKAGGAA